MASPGDADALTGALVRTLSWRLSLLPQGAPTAITPYFKGQDNVSRSTSEFSWKSSRKRTKRRDMSFVKSLSLFQFFFYMY